MSDNNKPLFKLHINPTKEEKLLQTLKKRLGGMFGEGALRCHKITHFSQGLSLKIT